METPASTGIRQKLRSARLTTTFAILTALSAGILVGSVFTGSVSGHEQQSVNSTDARPLSIPNPVTLSNSFSTLVKQVGPAVVNIDVESIPKTAPTAKRRGQRGQTPDGNGDQGDMQDFFNRFFGGQNPNGGGGDDESGPGPRKALGSGFIVDPRGYIITNNHVVDKADHIYVKLADDPDPIPGDPGRPATVIGVDKETDMAVIKIDTREPLPTIKLGNSDGAQVGDWVLAIGTPFGQRNTVSAGIISAKNREIQDGPAPSQFQRFIQTDAAINPGNSGGPLVDMAGQVIGMNTAIYTQSSGSEGIGFAMPSNTLIGVYNQLISPAHKVTRGSIGISFQAAQASAVTRMYGFASGGVLISSLTKNGPAEKAGLQIGDVITSVDGKSVKDGDELVAIVSAHSPGQTVRIGYMRDKKSETATVGITDRAKLYAATDNASVDDDTPGQVDPGQNKLGITVGPIPASSKSGIKSGVAVRSVRPGSFADEINLNQGSIITEINRKPVTDEASYRAIVSGLKPGDDVVFVIHNPNGAATGNSYVGGTLP